MRRSPRYYDNPVTVSLDGAANDGVNSLSSARATTSRPRWRTSAAATNDRLTGSAAANVIDAGSGDNMVNGGGGADILRADYGVDSLAGGPGNDALFAG